MDRTLVGVITRNRPALLADLLRSLAPEIDGTGAEVLVVDNDPNRTAELVVRDSERDGMSISYQVESLPGVVYPRNRILDAAGSFDAVVFLDDDEIVRAGWFRALLSVHDRHPESIVTGHVEYVLSSEAPAWVREGDFFDRPQYPDGAWLEATGTGNTLIPIGRLKALGSPRFDPRFSTGGEDTEFFRALRKAGVRIVWAEGACVREAVPPDRSTWVWLTNRYVRSGRVHARLALRDGRRPAVVVLGGAARILVGGARWMVRRGNCGPLRTRDIATYYAGKGYVKEALSQMRGQQHE